MRVAAEQMAAEAALGDGRRGGRDRALEMALEVILVLRVEEEAFRGVVRQQEQKLRAIELMQTGYQSLGVLMG